MTDRKWTKDEIIETIRTWHRNGCMPRSIRESNPAFEYAAKRLFGSWAAAQQAAGFRPKHVRRQWTREKIIAAIQAHHRAGVPVQKIYQKDIALIGAAARRFGTWRAAVRAAGFEDSHRTWSKERVIKELRKHFPRGRLNKVYPQLADAARHHFGSLHDGLEAAGLQPPGSRRRLIRWTQQMVVDAIRTRHAEGRPFRGVQNDDSKLYDAARRKFGTWHGALRAAGFDPKPRRRWSDELIADGLRTWASQPSGTLLAFDRCLADAVNRRFGRIATAMEALGIEPRPRRWTDRRVIEAIQNYYVQGKSIHTVGCGDGNLAEAAVRRFGSWVGAVSAAGLLEQYEEHKSKTPETNRTNA